MTQKANLPKLLPRKKEFLSNYVTINKPSGLLVHRSRIDGRERRFALQMVRDQIGQHVYPVHRLDKPVSGILLFALDPDTSRLTAGLFQSVSITKKYCAVVRGYTEKCGTIDHPLKEIKDKYIRRLDEKAECEYPAMTDYRRLATVELPYRVDKFPASRYSFVELNPKTGRRHQLRRHMRHISYPLIGDRKY